MICRGAGVWLGKQFNDSMDSAVMAAPISKWIAPYANKGRTPDMAEAFRKAMGRHLLGIPLKASMWGFKNPRAIFLVRFLADFFPKMKLVHVVRDGRDMAYSSNQNQPRLFAKAILPPGQAGLAGPLRAMALWQHVNMNAARVGLAFPGRYHLLRYEDLCRDTVETVAALLDFLEIPGDAEKLSSFVEPGRLGKWHAKNETRVREIIEIGQGALRFFGYWEGCDA